MKKIKYVSLFFRLLFQVTFVCMILGQVLGWIYAPTYSPLLNVIPIVYEPYLFHEFDINTKVSGFFITLMPLLLKLLVIYYLIKLFRLYEKHEFFSTKNVYYIRNAGYALLFTQIINPLCDFFLGFIITSGNPPGFRLASFSIRDHNLGLLLTSLVIILISWIMLEGCKLQDEQQLTI